MNLNFSIDFKEQGNQALKDGNIELALTYYSSGIDQSPDNHELYSNRSLVFFKLGNFELSLKDAEQTIKLSPNWFKVKKNQKKLIFQFRVISENQQV